jgi:predicted RecB family nuclease
MHTLPKITREVLENYLHCKMKGFLTLIGERGVTTEYESWHRAVVAQQKIDAAANFMTHYRGGTLKKDVVFAAFEVADAPDAILNAHLDTESFSLSFDALVKNKGPSLKGKDSYRPALFGSPTGRMPQKLLLGVLARIISDMQEEECSTGTIFREGGKPSSVRLSDILKKARAVLSDLEALRRGNAPSLVLNEHCQICEFRSRCHAQAIKEDNLSLLRGMDESAITRLNAKGIFTVNQLSYTFKARRRPKRAKKSEVAGQNRTGR